jgi:D-alanyl-D-alanine carboxypeptidase
MQNCAPLPTPFRRTRSAVLASVVLGVLAAAFVVRPSFAATARSSSGAPRAADLAAPSEALAAPSTSAVGEADGVIAHGAAVSVFDNTRPAVARLDGSLRDALRRAAKDAAADRISMGVSSGWRSSRYQAQLFEDAVRTYGSPREAARWVAPPETSAHVSGDAVDVGPSAADRWLSRHGATYGLCQIYRNEPWHYELRPDAQSHGCPRMYADASEDPRLQR